MIYCIFYDGKLVGLANLYSTAQKVARRYVKQLGEDGDIANCKIQQWYISCHSDFA